MELADNIYIAVVHTLVHVAGMVATGTHDFVLMEMLPVKFSLRCRFV